MRLVPLGNYCSLIVIQIIDKIAETTRHLLTKKNMKVALNARPECLNDLTKATENFLKSLPGQFQGFEYSTTPEDFVPTSTKVFYPTAFPVHFCSKSVPIVPYENPDFAAIRVLARLLSLKYLHPEIREKGGAYGSGLNANR